MKKVFFLFLLLCFFSITTFYGKADIYLATGVLTDKDSTDLLVSDIQLMNSMWRKVR